MILDLPSESNLTPKIKQLEWLISELLVETALQNRELSRI
jgi:hypothetical protein